MNAYEVLGIEYAVLVLEEWRRNLVDRCSWPFWEYEDLESWPDKMSTYLTSGVDYLRREVLTAVLDDLAECVLDSGIITIYEMSIHELHCERGFT